MLEFLSFLGALWPFWLVLFFALLGWWMDRN